MDQYGALKAFTIEDLAESHGAVTDELAFRGEINNSIFFETEAKRPFMYHCVPSDKIEEIEAPSVMEVNEALKLAEEMFPPKTGLYKKGALFDEKIVRFYFDFPLVQAKAAANRIKEYECLTGWKTEINSECRLIAAENLISELLAGSKSLLARISYYREDKAFLVTLSAAVTNKEEIKRVFYEKTGFSLKFSDEIQKESTVMKISGQMEQNKAFEYIDSFFSDKEHKPYKKSLKIKNNEMGIELCFLTYSLGQRYSEDLDKLSARIYWNIWVSPSANQHELLKIASECLASHNLPYKKLSFLPETQSIKVSVLIPPEEETVYAVKDAFMKKAGADLVFK